MDSEVESYFQKKFKFQNSEDSALSFKKPFESSSFKIPELQNLKNQLNSTKRLLSHMETQRWHEHTSFTNHAGSIFHRVKYDIRPELLTQAWLKFYECLVQYDLVSSSKMSLHNNVFQSVHLCEAPGAFIASLNHYLKLKHPNFEFRWIATTLNPYYEGNSIKSMIGDDRFIYHTAHNWNFGFDDTGDIKEWCNSEALLDLTKLQEVHLVTADGSVDCADNPGEQENHLTSLHWSETVSALLILSRGGSYVLKMFTLFEHSSVSLLYLLKLSFEELHVFKPCTSKEGNSEVYVIAIRYKKTEEVERLLGNIQLQVYERKIDISSKSLFPLTEIPETFLCDVVRCATFFKEHQEQAILRNLALYNMPPEHKNLETIKKKIADRFIQKYDLQRITRPNRIVSTYKRKCAFLESELGHIKRSDSLNILTEGENVRILQSELNEIDCHLKNFKLLEWVNPEKKEWRRNVCYTHGKDYKRLQNTKFCHTRVFRIFETLHEETMKKTCISSSRVYDMLLQEKQNFILQNFLDTTSTIEENGHFELMEIPVLSRFSVSTVWIISLLFDKIEVRAGSDPKICFLGYKEEIEILQFMRELDNKLLNFINIATLCDDQFCDFVSLYNTNLVLQSSLSLISAMCNNYLS